MNIRNYLSPLLIMQLFSCATIPDYKPIVDTSSVSDSAKYQKDYQECETITNNVDYSDEKTVAALKGAAVGAGVVGVGVASTCFLTAGRVIVKPVSSRVLRYVSVTPTFMKSNWLPRLYTLNSKILSVFGIN